MKGLPAGSSHSCMPHPRRVFFFSSTGCDPRLTTSPKTIDIRRSRYAEPRIWIWAADGITPFRSHRGFDSNEHVQGFGREVHAIIRQWISRSDGLNAPVDASAKLKLLPESSAWNSNRESKRDVGAIATLPSHLQGLKPPARNPLHSRHPSRHHNLPSSSLTMGLREKIHFLSSDAFGIA